MRAATAAGAQHTAHGADGLHKIGGLPDAGAVEVPDRPIFIDKISVSFYTSELDNADQTGTFERKIPLLHIQINRNGEEVTTGITP